MIDFGDTKNFFKMLDEIISNSKIVIDRKKGTHHPKYPSIKYEVDYGYLEGTLSMDNGGIDVWLGSNQDKLLDAVMVTVDIVKKDSEIKLLIGCNEEEKQKIYAFHNNSEYMKGILIKRS
ncbi:MAG: hypothetical protein BWY78_00595 [Alphaproteobacteria bacterium ADurb.Bin438]|nr:MAG: hypothetical protein BWY78_00595 [Alphaproteobacteria bacterium ADurb.Bin438]